MVNEKTNKDYCRTYHQKKGDLYKANDTTRKKNWNWKKKRRKCFKKKVAARVSECLKKRYQSNYRSATSTSETTPTSSAFSTKYFLSQSVHKTKGLLPSSPQKKAVVTGTLAKKFNLSIAVHNKAGRKKNKLSEDEEEWIDNFLERSDIMYTTARRRDTA